jgi:hypothetical protein
LVNLEYLYLLKLIQLEDNTLHPVLKGVLPPSKLRAMQEDTAQTPVAPAFTVPLSHLNPNTSYSTASLTFYVF